MTAEEDDREKSSDSSEAKGRPAPKRARQPITIDLEATVLDQHAAEADPAPPPPDREAADEAEPTQEPSAPPPAGAVPPAPPRGVGNWVGYFAAGLLGGLIAVLIGYGLFAGGILTGPDRVIAERAAADAGTAQASAAALDQRLAVLERAAAASTDSARIAELSDALKALDGAESDLRTEVNTLNAALADLTGRVTGLAQGPSAAALEDLNKRIDALGQAGGGGTVVPAAFVERVTRLENSLAVLSGRIDAITDRVGALAEKPAAAKEGARAIAVGALTQAAKRGGGFSGDLAMLLTLAPDDPVVGALQPFAAKGAPSREELTRRFPAVADAILAATAVSAPDAGFWQRLLDSARGLVTIRPMGPVPGDTPEAVVSRMTEAMKSGDLAAVLGEREKLPEAGKTASADFAKAAADRLTIDGLLDKLARRDAAPAGTQ